MSGVIRKSCQKMFCIKLSKCISYIYTSWKVLAYGIFYAEVVDMSELKWVSYMLTRLISDTKITSA